MSSIGDIYFAFRGDGARLKADAKKAGEAAGDVGGKGFATRFKKSFSGGEIKQGLLGGLGLGAGLGVANALSSGLSALTGEIFKSIDAASDLNEAVSKSEAVFKDASGEIEEWAGTASEAFGQSKRQALEAAGTFGNLIQAFGIGSDKAAEMSKSMVELASDLASFNNTSVDDALIALRSGLSGETEPLKRYGVAINDVRLKEEALRLGLIKTAKGVLPITIKTQAAYSLILKDTALAQGDFARTSDGLANTQKTLEAQMEDVRAAIGEELLPVMLELAQFVRDDLVPVLKAAAGAFKESSEEELSFVDQLIAGLGPLGTTVVNLLLLKDAANTLPSAIGNSVSSFGTMRSRATDLKGTLGDVAAAATDMGDETAAAARKARVGFGKFVDGLVADAQSLIADVFDPVQRRQDLVALKAEEAAQRKIIASKDSKDAEIADAKEALTQIVRDNLELRVQMLAAGELNKTEQAKLFADLERRLKNSTGKAKGEVQDLINKLRQLGGMKVKPKIEVGWQGHRPGTGPLEFASGGVAPAGVPFYAGEVGKELITPMSDGSMHVTPSSQTGPTTAGGTTQINVNLLDKLEIRGVRDIGAGLRMLEYAGRLR